MPEKRPGAQATADAIPTPVSIGNTHVLQICPQDNLASWPGLQTLDATGEQDYRNQFMYN